MIPGKVTRRDLRHAERQVKGAQTSIGNAKTGSALSSADWRHLVRLQRELAGVLRALAGIRSRVGRPAAQIELTRRAA